MQHSATETFLQEKPPRYTYPDPQAQAGRLQKQTDFLRFDLIRSLDCFWSLFCRCVHCFAARTGDLQARFCTECGLPWQPLQQTQTRLNQSDAHSVRDPIESWWNEKRHRCFCFSVGHMCQLPINRSLQFGYLCRVWNASLTRTSTSNQCRKSSASLPHSSPSDLHFSPSKTKLLCPICKATNPVHLRNCIVCESKLMPSTSPVSVFSSRWTTEKRSFFSKFKRQSPFQSPRNHREIWWHVRNVFVWTTPMHDTVIGVGLNRTKCPCLFNVRNVDRKTIPMRNFARRVVVWLNRLYEWSMHV